MTAICALRPFIGTNLNGSKGSIPPIVVIGVEALRCEREEVNEFNGAGVARWRPRRVHCARGRVSRRPRRQAPPRQSAAAPDGPGRCARLSAAPCKVGSHRSGNPHAPERRSRSLCIFWKEDFVLDSTGYHCEVSRFNCSLLGPNPQANRAFYHPNKLLMRVLVHGDMRVRLHSPIDHRALFAGYHAAADLVGDLLLRHRRQFVESAITGMPLSSSSCVSTISQ